MGARRKCSAEYKREAVAMLAVRNGAVRNGVRNHSHFYSAASWHSLSKSIPAQ
jgi:hypothetical protein